MQTQFYGLHKVCARLAHRTSQAVAYGKMRDADIVSRTTRIIGDTPSGYSFKGPPQQNIISWTTQDMHIKEGLQNVDKMPYQKKLWLCFSKKLWQNIV